MGGFIEGFGIYLLKGLAGGCGMGSMAVAHLHAWQGRQRDTERSFTQVRHRQRRGQTSACEIELHRVEASVLDSGGGVRQVLQPQQEHIPARSEAFLGHEATLQKGGGIPHHGTRGVHVQIGIAPEQPPAAFHDGCRVVLREHPCQRLRHLGWGAEDIAHIINAYAEEPHCSHETQLTVQSPVCWPTP